MSKDSDDEMLQSLLHSEASVEVVGYYGDKQAMQQLLSQRVGIRNELLSKGTLEPGLYACLLHPLLHIFLWLPRSEDQRKEGSRKDLACNFVRYLMDLCSTVHVCVPELILPTSEVAAMISNNKTVGHSRRTQRLKISRVKDSEDDIAVSPGFSLCLNLNQSCRSAQNNFLLSEGSSRCALLFSHKSTEMPRPVKKVERTTVYNLKYLLGQWKSSYDVDFTRLPDKDFLVLLEQVDTESFKKYNEKCEESEKVIKKHRECYSSTARDGTNSLKTLFHDTLSFIQQEMVTMRTWERYCLYAAEQDKACLSHGRCIISTFLTADFFPRFSKLEEQFLMQWTGQGSIDDKLGLVFQGARVQIVKADAAEEVVFPEWQDYDFKIVSRSSYICKKAPLNLGQKINITHKDKILLNNVTFNALPGCYPKGVLLAGVTLQMTFQNMTIPVQLKRLQGDSHVPGLLLWIDCLCKKRFREFRSNANYYRTTHGQSSKHKRENSARPNSITFSGALQECYLPLPEQIYNSSIFSGDCRDYYLSLANKILVPMLPKKHEFEQRKLVQKVEAEQKSSAGEFLAGLKQIMGVTRGQETTLSIIEIVVKSKHMLNWFQQDDELSLTVQYDYAARDFLLWKAVELVPMSNDIKEILQHSSDQKQQNSLIPKASTESQFLQLDVAKEKLLKCVLLKSSDVLFFLQDIESGFVTICRHPHLGCAPNVDAIMITTIKRGCDIIAFDESTRTTTFYDKSSTTAQLYRFDEAFKHCDWTGVEISLARFSGSPCIQWMELIPGKMEVVLIDDSWRVRVFEITPSAMMKPKHIQLPGLFVRAVISTDGSCLICLYPESDGTISSVCSSETQVVVAASGSPKLQLKVYLLGDSLSHLKDVPANLSFSDMTKVDARVVLFGSQMHLVIHSSENPKEIVSLVLRISSMKESVKMKEVSNSNCSSTADRDKLMETRHGKSCPHLDYIFHIYDKFPTCPPLVDRQANLEITLLLAKTLVQRTTVGNTATPSECKNYVQALLSELGQKGKSFGNLEITVKSYYLDEFVGSHAQVSQNNAAASIGTWINKLLSLVPVQIARAENNSLRPLINGLEIDSNLSYQDAVTMSNLIRFGFYDVILNSWNGNITVISSMGKQSSGKSYLLNHLTGSLFDVAGGRCTDGLWMTTRIVSNCLYVLLDFEGLGSFERSDQEDMLLSLLSAAMSNVTLFNKKEFHLDKETELLFDRFQSGVNLVTQDPKLFRGLFYIAIKDVDTADVEDLRDEFSGKISLMCSKSNDNFLLKMYNGDVEIATMAPFRSVEYQESVREIADTIQNVESSYNSGRSFMRDMKLLIAQICTKDWSPLDFKRAALRVKLLRQHLTSAVKMGCLSTESGKKALISFDTEDEVEDPLLQVEGVDFKLPDAGLELCPFQPSTMLGSILEKLKLEFEKIVRRTGEKDEIWFALFEKFLLALVERRKKRIFLWLECNSSDFSEDGDVQKLKPEANVALAELKEGLTPCNAKCNCCFLKCVLEKGHPHDHDHSCKGSHVCTNFCTFCVLKEEDVAAKQCTDVSGHGGPHNCKQKNHTCGMDCHLASSSSNCNNSCALEVGHPDPHLCNSLKHMCKEVCDAQDCKNTCIFPLERGNHEKHACHQTFCLSKCSIPLCPRSCATKDHFHALDPTAKHFCENEHLCQSECEADGICEVKTELVTQTCRYEGKRGSFEYEYQSEQNGLRKPCCIGIPAFCDKHDGVHMHSANPNVAHYCDEKCPSCGYFCNLPFGHAGLHRTVHGNMTLTRFVAESEEIDIKDRKYQWGESGKAEMCMMHCKSRGRGHIHLIPCPEREGRTCTSKVYDGARHETRKYGPDVDTPKDEMTHETYWKHVRFEDPCTEEDQKSFALCDHYCRSGEHQSEMSYCGEKLWHPPISRVGQHSSGAGFISDDGHHFDCYHNMDLPVSVIFVIDKSSSMGTQDAKPTEAKLFAKYQNRLGCVYESILRYTRTRLETVKDDTVSVVLFDTSAIIAVPPREMSDSIVDDLCKTKQFPNGGTRYSSGLEKTVAVLDELRKAQSTQVKKPIVIFLSDGGNWGGRDPVQYVRQMKENHPDLILHTIMFGNDPKEDILKKMAEAGEGSYQRSLDEVQLARSFQEIALSLRSKTAVAMRS